MEEINEVMGRELGFPENSAALSHPYYKASSHYTQLYKGPFYSLFTTFTTFELLQTRDVNQRQ